MATIVPDAGKTPEGLVMEWTVIDHDTISAMKKYTYRASNLANSNRTMISDSGFYGILYIYHVRNSEVLCLGFIHQIAWRTLQISDAGLNKVPRHLGRLGR